MKSKIVSKYFDSFDPEECIYLPVQIENISGATRRQVGEWIKRGIISVPDKAPGRGNARIHSFWNLMEAIIATEYGKIAHIQLLSDSMNQLQRHRNTVFQWLDSQFSSQINAESIPDMRQDEKFQLYMLISENASAKNDKSINPIVHIATDKAGYMSILQPENTLRKISPKALSKIKVFRPELPLIEISINLTHVFFKAVAGEINLRLHKK